MIGLVDLLGKPPVGIFTVGTHRNLQAGDGLWIPHVHIAVSAPMKVPGVWQHGDVLAVANGITESVATLHLFGQHREVRTLYTACRTPEGSCDDVLSKSNSLENLRAFVGLQCRDAHFRHHFEDALGHRFAVGIHHVFIVLDVFGPT